MLANAEADLKIRCSNMWRDASESNGVWTVSRDVYRNEQIISFKDNLPCWLYKNDLVKYFMQNVRLCLIIQLTNSLKNNIC